MTRDTFVDAVESLARTVEAETVVEIVAYLESQRPNLDGVGASVRVFAEGMDAALTNAVAGIKRGEWRRK